jgi:hypothetical protein
MFFSYGKITKLIPQNSESPYLMIRYWEFVNKSHLQERQHAK